MDDNSKQAKQTQVGQTVAAPMDRATIPMSDRPIIDSLVVLEQIERFQQIVNRDLIAKVEHVDQLIRDEFHDLSKMKEQCLTKEDHLDKHFPKLSRKEDIDRYMRMYRMCEGANTVLFDQGLYPVNRGMDRLSRLLMVELEFMYERMYECWLAMELITDSYEERSISENSFVQGILNQFDSFRMWAINQYFTLHTFQADFHNEKILQIHYYPQYEDKRRAFYRGEIHLLKSLIEISHNLLFCYINLVDLIRKNQNRLAVQLSKVNKIHREKVQEFREQQQKQQTTNKNKTNKNLKKQQEKH